MKVDFYCQDCDSEEFQFEIAQYPFTTCPICHSEDEDAVVWQSISEPCCPKCLNQSPIFRGSEVLEKDLPDYEAGTILNFYECSNCSYKFCISKDEVTIQA